MGLTADNLLVTAEGDSWLTGDTAVGVPDLDIKVDGLGVLVSSCNGY